MLQVHYHFHILLQDLYPAGWNQKQTYKKWEWKSLLWLTGYTTVPSFLVWDMSNPCTDEYYFVSNHHNEFQCDSRFTLFYVISHFKMLCSLISSTNKMQCVSSWIMEEGPLWILRYISKPKKNLVWLLVSEFAKNPSAADLSNSIYFLSELQGNVGMVTRSTSK